MLKTFPPTRLLLVRTLHSLIRVSAGARPAIQSRLFSATPHRNAAKTAAPTNASSRPSATKSTGFESLGLLPALIDALREENIQQATDVQLKSIPAILNGSDVLMAAQTGTGKTLAYLLPIIHRLKQEEVAGFTPRPGRPRVLLLAPTRELAQQVGRVSKLLSYHAVFRSVCLSVEDSSKAMQKVQLKTKLLDVVIATPARLQYHIVHPFFEFSLFCFFALNNIYFSQIQGNISMSDVHTIVMDEADTLFDHSFSEMTEKLVHSIQYSIRLI
jgi:superfamily II DNA/RNA helicase